MTASAIASQKLFSRNKLEMGLHKPSDTGADECSSLGYVDLRDFDAFAVLVAPSYIAGNSAGVTRVEIVAAEDSSGTNVTQIKDSGVVNTNDTGNTGVCDYVALEAIAEEIEQIGRAAGLALRYVAARITCDSESDEAAVAYVRGLAKREYRDLTASKVG